MSFSVEILEKFQTAGCVVFKNTSRLPGVKTLSNLNLILLLSMFSLKYPFHVSRILCFHCLSGYLYSL